MGNKEIAMGLRNVAHKNLDIWKLGVKLCAEIYSVTKNLPEEEKYGLTSQLRRAAISVPTNTTEGSGRNTESEFLNFLHIARSSLSELDTLLILSLELGFLKKEQLSSINELIFEIYNKLNALINKIRNKHE